jgi:hypothetical protein
MLYNIEIEELKAKEKIEKNLKEQKNILENKISNSRIFGSFFGLYRRITGTSFNLDLDWNWIDEKTLELNLICSVMMIKPEFFDKEIAKLHNFGRMKITRMEGEKVIEV